MSEQQPSKDNRWVEAYNRMLERLRHFREHEGHPFQDALAAAREKTAELGELSREEADRVAEYLRRDVEEAASYLSSGDRQDLADWFRFDVTMIEAGILERFLSVADPTKLELSQLELEARRASVYRTGEVIGMGTLRCLECGELLHFPGTGQVPPCPSCKGTEFVRAEAGDAATPTGP